MFRKIVFCLCIVLVLSLPLFAVHAQAEVIKLEAEKAIGNGVKNPRSNASRQKTRHIDCYRPITFSFTIITAGWYKIVVRYANDNFPDPTEWLQIFLDGEVIKEFFILDTGNNGEGWNIFKQAKTPDVELTAGDHTIQLVSSNGDGYGLEVDFVKLIPVDPPAELPIIRQPRQFDPGTAATELLVNGSFDKNDELPIKRPDGWTANGKLRSDAVRCFNNALMKQPVAVSSPNAFKFQGYPNETGKLEQAIKLEGLTFTVGDTLTFSARVDQKTAAVGTLIGSAVVTYTAGDPQILSLHLPDPKVKGYTLITSDAALTGANVESITVELFYHQPTGSLFLDDVSLLWTPVDPPALPAALRLGD